MEKVEADYLEWLKGLEGDDLDMAVSNLQWAMLEVAAKTRQALREEIAAGTMTATRYRTLLNYGTLADLEGDDG